MEDKLLYALLGRNAVKKVEAELENKADLVNGVIPANQIPPEVFERMKVVADDTARFALTTSDVQEGDIVYVNATQIMYYVFDEEHLDSESGYKPFSAGVAVKAIGDKNGNDITTTYQPIIDSSHMLSADLVDDTNATHKFATAAQLTQISTNETNISLQQDTIADGGNGYALVNGTRVYVSATEPTGDIPDGSIWIGG